MAGNCGIGDDGERINCACCCFITSSSLFNFKGMFYWCLINIENHQMYTLTGIQLLAVANVNY